MKIELDDNTSIIAVVLAVITGVAFIVGLASHTSQRECVQKIMSTRGAPITVAEAKEACR